MYNLLNDMSLLTTIPVSNLERLSKQSNYIICDCIEDTCLQGKDYLEIFIGIGTLHISVKDSQVLYRFVPCGELEKGIQNTFINHKNPLVKMAEDTLKKKLVATYKDFI